MSITTIILEDEKPIHLEGKISGYYNSQFSNENYNNYFISNSVDSGNSGGPAIANINGEQCFLGLVTWLNQGNYQNQGIVQNIWNITDTNQ